MSYLNNIFVSTTFAEDNSKVSDVLALCAKENISNIELGSNHIYEKNLQNIIKQYDFRFLVHNYFPVPKKEFVVNIASISARIRSLSLKHIKRSINFCRKINSQLYTFHPGFIGDPLKSNKKKKNYDFIWKKEKQNINYKLAFRHMLSSLKKIVNFAKKQNVKIAIETEGSFKKKKFALMQKPEEYNKLLKYFTPKDLGISLNIGHLNLASKAFGFSKMKFINDIEDYIVAMELSHNNGVEDQHLPIKENAWYWEVLKKRKFASIPKILEYRNCELSRIKKSIKLIQKN